MIGCFVTYNFLKAYEDFQDQGETTLAYLHNIKHIHVYRFKTIKRKKKKIQQIKYKEDTVYQYIYNTKERYDFIEP